MWTGCSMERSLIDFDNGSFYIQLSAIYVPRWLVVNRLTFLFIQAISCKYFYFMIRLLISVVNGIIVDVQKHQF